MPKFIGKITRDDASDFKLVDGQDVDIRNATNLTGVTLADGDFLLLDDSGETHGEASTGKVTLSQIKTYIETGNLSITGDISAAGGDLTVTNALNAGGLIVKGDENNSAAIELWADDEGDDNADKWQIESSTSDNKLYFYSYESGNWVSKLVITTAGVVTTSGDLYVGGNDIIMAAASDAALKIQASSGTDTAGSNLTISAGQGTGTGDGGDIIFKVADGGGGSGDGVNSLATALTIFDDKSATFTAGVTATQFNGSLTGNVSGSSGSCTGNAATATALETARNIGGVSFDGTANINLPGVNTSGNQNTSGNAATATALETARNIGGVSFDGTGNINLPGVNTTGNQDTSGNATTATLASTVTITDNENANEINAIVFTSGGALEGGNLALESDGTLNYNPSSGTLVATAFQGALVGNATTATSAGTVTGTTQTNITTCSNLTTVGTIATGVWEGTDIGIEHGGTGASTSDDWLNSRITTSADGSLNYDGTGAVAVNHDSLAGFVANEHIDWTGASAGTIHATNYTNTMGSGFTVSATTDTTATTITEGDDLMFAAGTGISQETTADGTVTTSLAAIADDTVLGNISGGSAAPSALTAANLQSILNTNDWGGAQFQTALTINGTEGGVAAINLLADENDDNADYWQIKVEDSDDSNKLEFLNKASGLLITTAYAIPNATLSSGAWVFNMPGTFQYANNGGDSIFNVLNSAAAGSTDERTGIKFNHVSTSTNSAGIFSKRIEDFSSDATKSANLTFEVVSNNTIEEAAVLAQGDTKNTLTLGGTDTLPYHITTGGAANILLTTNTGTDSGKIMITDAANGSIVITPNGTGQVELGGTAYFDEEDSWATTEGAVNPDLDFRTSNKQKITVTGNSPIVIGNNPAGPCNIVLKVIQGDGSDTVSSWSASSGSIYWAGGSAPTLSTGSGDVDIITFYFDGTNYYGAYA